MSKAISLAPLNSLAFLVALHFRRADAQKQRKEMGAAPARALVMAVLTLFLVLHLCKGQRIGLLTTEVDMRYRADVALRLNETGRFESVTFLNESSLPTLEELVGNFEALLVWSGMASEPTLFSIDMAPFPEPEQWGDLLQGFVEQGGGVVLAVAGFSGANGLKGAFASQSSVILPQSDHELTKTESGATGHKNLGRVHLPDHPTMHNITSFQTTGIAIRTSMLPSQVKRMAEGSYAVAAFNDGVLLMAVRDEIGPNKTNRVDLNFHPVSEQKSINADAPGRISGGWKRNTDGRALMANALYYSMSGCGSFAPQPLTIITCSEGMSVEGEEREMAVPEFSNSPSLRVVGTCHGPINITQSPAAGTLLAVGLHNITVQVEDALGTLLQCTTTFNFTLTKQDTSTSSTSDGSSSGGSNMETSEEKRADNGSDLPLALGLGLGLPLLLIVVAAIVAAVLLRRRTMEKRRRMQKDLEEGGESMYQRNPIKPSRLAGKEGSAEHADRGMGFNWNIQFSELTLGEEIGRGGFGVVMKGKWRGTAVAIKQILAKHNNELEQLKSEMEIMQNLRPHGNVLLLLGVCEDHLHNHYVVTEFMAKGDLRHFLMSEEGEAMVNYQMMVQMAREIAVGMSHLHSEGIIHRDLAARNLLLTEELTIKISDFGLSRLKRETDSTEEQTTKSEVGPLKWMAPESISQQMYSQKSDVWSYGVVLWEIVNFGEEPYPHLSLVQAALAVVDQKVTLDIPEDIPEVLQRVMKACWQYDPKDRPTMDDIVAILSSSSSS